MFLKKEVCTVVWVKQRDRQHGVIHYGRAKGKFTKSYLTIDMARNCGSPFCKAVKSTDKKNTSLSDEVEVSRTVLTCSELTS